MDAEEKPVFVPIPHKKKRVDISHVMNEDIDVKRKRLVEIFKEIPWKTWEDIVREEPEWKFMNLFLNYCSFGPFAVLMVATGLNDYQLKGKAGKVYWPEVRRLLEFSPTSNSPRELFNLLESFYQKEHLNTMKMRRLRRFLDSPLVDKLWKSSPQEVSAEFLNIWRKLGGTMGQKPEDKTICFAMKCLGISLLMMGEYKFDFTPIPIPVDSRVVIFTQKAGLCANDREQEIRAVWSEILHMLQIYNPNITMIHLDSLIWQIATMNDDQLEEYFRNLNVPEIGNNLSTFLQIKSKINPIKRK